MLVARLATAGFGVLTIIVALLIKNMGGIVEVILSVAALTGGALYLPPLWSLFSKRQTGRSILTATLVSLFVNSVFKFATPYLFSFALTRGQEMILGVVAPIVVLILFELKYLFVPKENTDYNRYLEIKTKQEDEPAQQIDSGAQNRHGRKVISIGVIGTGILIVSIGLFAATGKYLVIGAGILIVIVGLLVNFKKSKLS